MIIDIIAGARPNFIKISPIINQIIINKKNGKKIDYRLIHTGQHYDQNMSENFFKELEIPFPDYNLNSGSGTQSEQTSKIMIGYEKLIFKKLPSYCLVVGDVNSTMACSIVAKKMNIPVMHVEAGIRSGDLTMPEEINRIVTDSISDYFFTTSKTANENLIKSGIDEKRIFFVGNTMIDTLLNFRNKFKKPIFWKKLNLMKKNYFILTLHRPSNVDDEQKLTKIINEISFSAKNIPVIFPAHPRTKKVLSSMNLKHKNLFYVEPMGYLNFNYLVEKSLGVITDSGGITEETTVLNVPCLTFRDSTERPETIEYGTNKLLGTDPKFIPPAINQILSNEWKTGSPPPLWDGKTSVRIIEHILKLK